MAVKFVGCVKDNAGIGRPGFVGLQIAGSVVESDTVEVEFVVVLPISAARGNIHNALEAAVKAQLTADGLATFGASDTIELL